MSATFPPLPTLGSAFTDVDYKIWDINIRYAMLQVQQADSQLKIDQDTKFQARNAALDAAELQYRKDFLAGLIALASPTPFAGYTDQYLLLTFMSALMEDWASASRGSAANLVTAQGMVATFRSKFPAPPAT